jgi:hypothetical protein
MEKKTMALVKKNHTLLPHHRPPLRRDKPVRVSIPDAQARYIFPSADRSFIFIPRAMRPNQQFTHRGRGRGSFHGSRRTSVYGGSNYSPSVAMSRKSSIGAPSRDVMSPVGMYGQRNADVTMPASRPVVRMLGGNVMSFNMLPTRNSSGGSQYASSNNGTMSYGYPSNAMTMHQPRPQKQVSLAGIESPSSLAVTAPQQQQNQPFHHQVPHNGEPGNGAVMPQGQFAGPGTSAGTPLSHIPEGAVYANPFQPYPMMQNPMMYGAPFYPVMGNGMQYVPTMPAMPMYQPYAMSQGHNGQHQAGTAQHANAMAHETNGMVYYNPDTQTQPDGALPQQQYMAGPVMGMPTVMNPQAPYYYPAPTGMYYPTQSA